jgi:hypothetical protein
MPAGSTWSRSKSESSNANAWIAASTTRNSLYPRYRLGNKDEIPPETESNGCSQPKKHVRKWSAPIPLPLPLVASPKSQNLCDPALDRPTKDGSAIDHSSYHPVLGTFSVGHDRSQHSNAGRNPRRLWWPTLSCQVELDCVEPHGLACNDLYGFAAAACLFSRKTWRASVELLFENSWCVERFSSI